MAAISNSRGAPTHQPSPSALSFILGRPAGRPPARGCRAEMEGGSPCRQLGPDKGLLRSQGWRPFPVPPEGRPLLSGKLISRPPIPTPAGCLCHLSPLSPLSSSTGREGWVGPAPGNPELCILSWPPSTRYQADTDLGTKGTKRYPTRGAQHSHRGFAWAVHAALNECWSPPSLEPGLRRSF